MNQGKKKKTELLEPFWWGKVHGEKTLMKVVSTTNHAELARQPHRDMGIY